MTTAKIGVTLVSAQAQGRGGATPQQFNESAPGFKIHGADLAVAAGTLVTDPIDLGHGGVLSATLTTANLTGSVLSQVLTSSDDAATDPYRPASRVDSGCATYAAQILGKFTAQNSNTTQRAAFVVDRWVKFSHVVTTGPIDITVDGFIRAS